MSAAVPTMMAPGIVQGANPQQQQQQQDRMRSIQDYRFWQQRLKAARRKRSDAEKEWKRLLEAYEGQRIDRGDGDFSNGLAEYVSVLMPHLVGEDLEVVVKPIKASAGEDPYEKTQFAQMLGMQATALGRAVGLQKGANGMPGELQEAYMNSMWSVGIMQLGFEVRRGMGEGGRNEDDPDDSGQLSLVDIDFSMADRREQHDAGMPWARALDPTRVLFDPTYNDIRRAEWIAVEYYRTQQECRAIFGKDVPLTPRFTTAPVWPEEETNDKSAEHEGQANLIGLVDIYTRTPSERITLAMERQDHERVLKREPIALGVEGLPFLILGFEWSKKQMYPIPPFKRVFRVSKDRNDQHQVASKAGRQLKHLLLVNNGAAGGEGAKVTEQIANADDNGIVGLDDVQDLDGVVKAIDIGGTRPEHFEIMDRDQQAFDRASGIDEMQLGLGRRGDPTNMQLQQQEGASLSRMNHKVSPANDFASATYSGIVAITYEKIDLLHGMQLPIENMGPPGLSFVTLDASRPVIGEMLDYGFEVKVRSAMTTADEINGMNQALAQLPNYEAWVNREGYTLQFVPLLRSYLQKMEVAGHEHILVPLPPPPPMAAAQQQGAMAPGMAAQPGPAGAPQAQAGPQDPIQAEIDQLVAHLDQLPDGDPTEDEILARLAELGQAAMGGAAA